jgi:hypothetical protein
MQIKPMGRFFEFWLREMRVGLRICTLRLQGVPKSGYTIWKIKNRRVNPAGFEIKSS